MLRKDEKRVIPGLCEEHGGAWEPRTKEYCVESVGVGVDVDPKLPKVDCGQTRVSVLRGCVVLGEAVLVLVLKMQGATGSSTMDKGHRPIGEIKHGGAPMAHGGGFDHEKLDVDRLSLEFQRWVGPLIEEGLGKGASAQAVVKATGQAAPALAKGARCAERADATLRG